MQVVKHFFLFFLSIFCQHFDLNVAHLVVPTLSLAVFILVQSQLFFFSVCVMPFLSLRKLILHF